MAISTLQETFLHDLGDIYDAEHRFLEAQQQLLPQASNPQLQEVLHEHIAQTQQQIQNIEQIFQIIGQQPKRATCQAAVGLVQEGQQTVQQAGNEAVRDALIAGAQGKVEHYEIASYRTLLSSAKLLGVQQAAMLLQHNLEQEETASSRVDTHMPHLLSAAARVSM
jgi:ferritin-like metal-binding protein YciE